MFFNLQSWRERFDQARTERNANLVRELLDELAREYSRMCRDHKRSVFARLVME
jgi:hypothetical protein